MRTGPKDWSPRNPWSPEQVWQTLRRLAPSVVFSIHREIDRDFAWDGDGPDPEEEGYKPYNIEVKTAIIAEGRLIEHSEYLGGSYDKPGDFDPDVHGYLPQMLLEALNGLPKNVPKYLDAEIEKASTFLKQVIKARYDMEQRARDRGGR
jgi:hypothetical protein